MKRYETHLERGVFANGFFIDDLPIKITVCSLGETLIFCVHPLTVVMALLAEQRYAVQECDLPGGRQAPMKPNQGDAAGTKK